MKMTIDVRWLALAIGCALTVMAVGGPLDPPAGPVDSTYKTLDEVEARRPVNDTFAPPSTGSRHVITSSGSYYLTGNLTVSGLDNAIEVTAPNVTIDLNGYTITGSTLFGAPQRGVFVANAVQDGILTLRNGTITGFAQAGVRSAQSDVSVILRDLVLAANPGSGAFVSGDCDAASCQFLRNGNSGLVAGFGSMVRDCRALDNGGFGISVLTGSVLDCVVEGSGVDGISAGSIDEGLSIVRGNVVSSSGGFGVSGLNAIIEGNAIANSENGGIRTQTVSQFTVNADGIIRGNFLRNNGTLATEAAIDITGSHYRVDGNTITDSPIGVRVSVGGDNVITRNTLDDVTTSVILVPGGNVTGLIGTDYSTDRAWQNVDQ
jgi:hypothetical protein